MYEIGPGVRVDARRRANTGGGVRWDYNGDEASTDPAVEIVGPFLV
jgi:hypothetical protein